MSTTKPLVSVVTPVHNGEKYLSECIESVLTQNYEKFEYVIVNNASTDGTEGIARIYASKDSRIKVYNTEALLPIMQNWNRSMRQISTQSKYCKIVHADDWLFKNCLSEMVNLAEQYPTIGIVGAYALQNTKVVCGDGLPYPSTVMSGQEVCKLTLLNQTYPFLRPSCLLIRSDLIRNRDPFYNEEIIHADVEACYELLRTCEFGFIHQVLSFVRWHEESVTLTFEKPWNKSKLWNLDLLVRFGKEYLTEEELKEQLEKQLKRYYQVLARAKDKKMESDYWDYHRQELEKLGFPFSKWRLNAAWLLNSLVKVSGSLRDRIHWFSNNLPT